MFVFQPVSHEKQPILNRPGFHASSHYAPISQRVQLEVICICGRCVCKSGHFPNILATSEAGPPGTGSWTTIPRHSSSSRPRTSISIKVVDWKIGGIRFLLRRKVHCGHSVDPLEGTAKIARFGVTEGRGYYLNRLAFADAPTCVAHANILAPRAGSDVVFLTNKPAELAGRE